MFSRWSQENFFKYLREQFNLDSLPTHDLAPLDPDAQVVNPVRRALEKTIRQVRSRLAAARNRLAVALQEHRDTTTRLEADATALAAELDELTQRRADTPTHVRAGDLPEQDKLDALPVGGRLFLDVVRMIAYRAETRMMALSSPPRERNRMPAGCCARCSPPTPTSSLRLPREFSGYSFWASAATPATVCSLPWSRNSTQPTRSIPAPISGSSTSWPAIRSPTCHLILAEVRKSETISLNSASSAGVRTTG